MGEPVTTGMMIGAASGALMNRKNPIQGAMMGGAMGAAGGSFAGGFGGLGGGAGAAGSANAMIPGVQGGFGTLGAGLGDTTALTGAPTFMERLSAGGSGLMGDIGAANKFLNQNPTTSQIGFGLAKDLMAPDQPIQMPGGMPVQRGQIQPMDYMSLLNPQQQTVIRPATPSLI